MKRGDAPTPTPRRRRCSCAAKVKQLVPMRVFGSFTVGPFKAPGTSVYSCQIRPDVMFPGVKSHCQSGEVACAPQATGAARAFVRAPCTTARPPPLHGFSAAGQIIKVTAKKCAGR